MSQKLRNRIGRIPTYVILISAAVVALFPIVLIFFNSFKERKAIFNSPLMPPLPETFSLIGYEKVLRALQF